MSIKDGSGTDITNDQNSIGNINPYRYRGYRYETETQMYYLNSRYYNPYFERFINCDKFGGVVGALLSHNTFAYCMNNPVNMQGTSGYWSSWLPMLEKYIKNVPIVKDTPAAITTTVSNPLVKSTLVAELLDNFKTTIGSN